MEALGRIVTPGIKLTALADDLGFRKQDYSRLRATLAGLVAENAVTVLPGGAFALAPAGRSTDRKGKKLVTVPPPLSASTHKNPKAAAAALLAKVEATVSVAPRERTRRIPTRGAAKPRVQAKAAAPIAAPSRAPAPAKPTLRASTRNVPAIGAHKESKIVAQPNIASAVVPVITPVLKPATPPSVPSTIEGRITVHPAGYGFVATDLGFDVFVPAKYRASSLDGDQVVVKTWPGVKGTEGRVEEIKSRGRARLTGVVRRVGRQTYLEPDDPRIAADFGRVALDGDVAAPDGAAVVVEITRYPTPVLAEMAARLIKVLGDPGDPRTEIEKIIAIAGMPVEFPADALAQAAKTAQTLGPDDFADRIDLRSRRFATIDPETARDFDDALCIEDGPHGGPRVWIAVADVSHYVKWDDPLDRESTLRGVSVYLPDRVISMLPIELSAGICSLNPDVDRCAMVVRIDFKDDGEIVDTGYAAAVIRSHARLDYPGAAAALHGDFRGARAKYLEWADEIARLDKLAQTLRAKRRGRGALDLELPEAKVILDADDPLLVRDVVKAKGDPQVKRAYELVEEFMLAANDAVGRFFKQRGATAVWRIHAPPQRERVELLAQLLGAYGIKVDVEAALTPLGMKLVLDQVNEMRSARSLSFLVLRTLTQAIWGIDPVGHFGLASADYLQFTSPIRRYPDLLVHRLLKYHLHKEGQASGGGYRALPPPPERLAELASAASSQERRAMVAEREAVSMYRAYVMREQIGEHFAGIVSSVTSFGAFIEIEDPYVEGLVKLDALGAEQFYFDEIGMRLRGARTGRTITLGDAVTVEVRDVSVARRRIELALVENGKVVAPMEPGPFRGPPGGRPNRSNDRDRKNDRNGRPDRNDRNERRPGGRPDNRPAAAPAPGAPRVGLSKQRRAGREVERAVVGHRDARDGGANKTRRGGGLSLKVSHRGRPGGKSKKR